MCVRVCMITLATTLHVNDLAGGVVVRRGEASLDSASIRGHMCKKWHKKEHRVFNATQKTSWTYFIFNPVVHAPCQGVD